MKIMTEYCMECKAERPHCFIGHNKYDVTCSCVECGTRSILIVGGQKFVDQETGETIEIFEDGQSIIYKNREENNMKNEFIVHDAEAILEVVKTLEEALVEEKPYSLTTIDKNGERTAEVSREEFLEHYSNWATEAIYALVDIKKAETKNVTNLKEIAHELDHKVGGLLLNAIDIDDIQTMAGHLSEDVENADLQNFQYRYFEISRQLRVISNYLRHVSRDLTENHKEIELLKNNLFDKVARNNG